MTRGVDILLGEILEAIDLLRQYTDGLDYVGFESNVEKQDSVVRRLEIIGEAVKGIPDTSSSTNTSASISRWHGRWFSKTCLSSKSRCSVCSSKSAEQGVRYDQGLHLTR